MFSGYGTGLEKTKVGSTIREDIMKLRDKILYMSFGAGLIVLGMILNSLTGRYANAQEESVNVETNEQKGSENVTFKNITCESIVSKTGFMIKDGSGLKAIIGLDDNGDARLVMYGEDSNHKVAYLGPNTGENGEVMLKLQSRSQVDKREASMRIDKNGGRFDCYNKMGSDVARLVVGSGGGVVDLRDKFGEVK